MSSRIFQSIVLQLKDCTDRPIGVIDAKGTVVACNELSCIGERIPGVLEPLAATPGMAVSHYGRIYKQLSNGGSLLDYSVFVSGDDNEARLICNLAAVSLETAKTYDDEKHDRVNFIKNIISDNILLGDVHARAKELHFVGDPPRGVFLIRQIGSCELTIIEAIQSMFPDRNADFVISINDIDVVLVKQLPENSDGKELNKVAAQIQDLISKTLGLNVIIGIGTVARELRELARSYKEAQVAIDVGRVFETEKAIINYESLGIGRLIYQLPTTLCEMFLQEVFKKNPIDALDQETLFTINKFFENNLNVSETARKLFVHRNTLVYRLEKIKKLTGLDLREFDDAITFKVALMVKKYLNSCGFLGMY